MLRWALKGVDASKVTQMENAVHSGVEHVYETGKITVEGKQDKINNIYDLEGNGYEWIAEVYSVSRRVARGGRCYSSGAPSNRDIYAPAGTSETYCSRCVLYIS